MRVCVYCKTRYKIGSGITFHKFPTDSRQKLLWLKSMKMENRILKCNDHICSKHFTEDCFVKPAFRTLLKKGSVPTLFDGSTLSACHNEVVTPTACSFGTISGVKRGLICTDDYQENTSQNGNTLTACHNEAVTPTPCLSRTIGEVKRKLSCTHDNQENTFPNDASRSGILKKPMVLVELTPILQTSRTISQLCENVRHDHSYHNLPESSNKELERVKKCLNISRATVKVLSRSVKRLKDRVSCLKNIITKLKRTKPINDDCSYHTNIVYNCQDFKPVLLKRMLKKKVGKKLSRNYPIL